LLLRRAQSGFIDYFAHFIYGSLRPRVWLSAFEAPHWGSLFPIPVAAKGTLDVIAASRTLMDGFSAALAAVFVGKNNAGTTVLDVTG